MVAVRIMPEIIGHRPQPCPSIPCLRNGANPHVEALLAGLGMPLATESWKPLRGRREVTGPTFLSRIRPLGGGVSVDSESGHGIRSCR